MEIGFSFFFNSTLLGVGLAMDAFSVSLANGLNEPGMRKRRISAIALVFAVFQAIMPMIGWTCIHTILSFFDSLQSYIPWIALFLLCYIGANMIYESLSQNENPQKNTKLGFSALLLQGLATSIDALSVGFTISDYGFKKALASVLIIAVVTFFISAAGIIIGKKAGTRFAEKSGIFGGVILIFIGIEIFLTGIF